MNYVITVFYWLWATIHPCNNVMGWSILRITGHCCVIVQLVDLYHSDGFVQERRYSSVLAMELRLYCTNPSIRKLMNCTKQFLAIFTLFYHFSSGQLKLSYSHCLHNEWHVILKVSYDLIFDPFDWSRMFCTEMLCDDFIHPFCIWVRSRNYGLSSYLVLLSIDSKTR